MFTIKEDEINTINIW